MLAPPCKGPHRAETAPATDANGFAPPEAIILQVEVEQFCSWSACSKKIKSSALETDLGFRVSHLRHQTS